MLIIPPPAFRKRRKAAKSRASLPPGAALMLVSATYDPGDLFIVLTFDRAIDVAGIVGSTIVVDDQRTNGQTYQATGAVTLQSPQSVRIDLTYVADSSGDLILLNAQSGNGIVAVDDGGTWAGVTDLELPYP